MELLEVKKIPKMKISLNDYIEWKKQYQWPLRQGNWNCPQWSPERQKIGVKNEECLSDL